MRGAPDMFPKPGVGPRRADSAEEPVVAVGKPKAVGKKERCWERSEILLGFFKNNNVVYNDGPSPIDNMGNLRENYWTQRRQHQTPRTLKQSRSGKFSPGWPLRVLLAGMGPLQTVWGKMRSTWLKTAMGYKAIAIPTALTASAPGVGRSPVRFFQRGLAKQKILKPLAQRSASVLAMGLSLLFQRACRECLAKLKK